MTQQAFTKYQKFVIFLLAITQFTVVLDFMVMSPLGDMMIASVIMLTSIYLVYLISKIVEKKRIQI